MAGAFCDSTAAVSVETGLVKAGTWDFRKSWQVGFSSSTSKPKLA